MKRNFLNTALLAVFVLFTTSVFAQGFITAGDFMKIYKDSKTVVISAQKDKNYEISHITNSVFIEHKSLYKDGAIEGLIKSPADMAKIFGSKGVSNTSKIVIYDDGENKYAGRIYWILKYLGAADVQILHKDLSEWRKSRIPITNQATSIKATTFTPNVNAAILCDLEFVKSHLKDANTVVVDVRAADEYKGTSDDPKSDGHLPGAVNMEWKLLTNENGSVKSVAELQAILKKYGITPEKTVVFYCTTSVRAGLPYLILTQILGYKNVKVYDGAYNEWKAKGNTLVK